MADKKLSKAAKSVLLYFEARVVDYGGLVDTTRLKKEEFEIIPKLVEAGLIIQGEPRERQRGLNMWVELTEEGWAASHAARRERADQSAANRKWTKFQP